MRAPSDIPRVPVALAALLVLLGVPSSGCEDTAPTPAEVLALVQPHLGRHVSGPSARAAIQQVLPTIVDDLRNGSPPAPSATTASALVDEFLLAPWSVSDPGTMWSRVSPAPGQGREPPAPGEP